MPPKGVVVEVFTKSVHVSVVKTTNREKLAVTCCFKMISLISKGLKITLVFWHSRGLLVWLTFHEDYLHNFPACNWRILSTFVEILLDKNCLLSSQRHDLWFVLYKQKGVTLCNACRLRGENLIPLVKSSWKHECHPYRLYSRTSTILHVAGMSFGFFPEFFTEWCSISQNG